MPNTSPTRYGRLSIAIHWLVLLLMILTYLFIEFRGIFPKGTPERDWMKAAHFTLGLTIFLLTWVRIALRITQPTPAIAPPSPAWQNTLAKLMHLALYALMLGAPIAGWLILSGEGKPIPFWGWHLPALIGENKALAHSIEAAHVIVGKIGYALIGAHALAALYHHYILKDNALTNMLPLRHR